MAMRGKSSSTPGRSANDGRHLIEAELARRWRISPRTLARWRRAGRAPPHLMLGRTAIYPIDAVEAFELAHLRDAEVSA